MEDGEIKKSPAIDEVINVSYKMFLFILLCLTLFPPVATDIESEIAERIAKLEILIEYNDSHPYFIESVIDRNIVFLQKYRTLKYPVFIIFLALLLLTSLADARTIEKMSIY